MGDEHRTRAATYGTDLFEDDHEVAISHSGTTEIGRYQEACQTEFGEVCELRFGKFLIGIDLVSEGCQVVLCEFADRSRKHLLLFVVEGLHARMPWLEYLLV